MKNNRPFILVVILSIVILIGLFFSVYKITSSNKKEFLNSGYVNTYELESSKKVYFLEGTEYKNTYQDTVKFKNSTNEQSEVSKYSFVIYENKNIGYLNNGVLMNLDQLDEDFIPYYNIKSNYLIKYDNGSYVINTLNEDIKFNNFIGKISDSKYIVAGNNVKLVKDNKEYSSFYFEVSFEDKNVIRIVNDLVNITTVNENTYLLIDNDIKIDLINQKIVYKDTDKLYLNEITITNDENIDIKYDEESDKKEEENTTVDNKTVENKEDNNQNNNNDNNTENYKTQTVVDYKTNPYLELLNVNVTSSKISIMFNVKDPNKMITNDLVTITLKDLETGISETKHVTVSDESILFSKDNLASNHQYLITITTKYDKGYTLILLQRTFTTNKIGLDLNLDCVTSSSLDYLVSLSSTSLVEELDVKLYDENLNLLNTLNFKDLNPSDIISASFEGLESNTEYITRIENVVISGVKYETGYAASDERKTLKKTPYDLESVSNPNAKVNKKDNTVSFNASSIEDPDGAYNSIEYNIYEVENGEYKLVQTVKRGSLAEFAISSKDINNFDNTKEYTFDVKITSYDNEKTITYTTNKSNSFSFSNKVFPSATFVTSELLNNYIKGKFLIYDPDDAITNNTVKIKYADKLGNSNEITGTISTDAYGDKYVDVELNDLSGLNTYVVSLFASVDISSDDKPLGEYLLGAVSITTQKSNEINVSLDDKVLTDVESLDDVFRVGLKLEVAEGTDEEVAEGMSDFIIQLYYGHDAPSGHLIASLKVTENIKEEYFDNEKILTLSSFTTDAGVLNLTRLKQFFLDKGTSISKNYSLKLIKGNSSLGYIEFRETGENLLNFDINDAVLDLDGGDATISVEQLMENDITTALKVTAEFTKNKDYATDIVMKIVDVTDGNAVEAVNKTIAIDDPDLDVSQENQYSYIFNFSDYPETLKRGRVYKVSYYVKLDIGGQIYKFPFGDNIGANADPNPVESEEIFVLKKEPSMVLYPITSSENGIIYKYKITDTDSSFTGNIKYSVNENYNLTTNNDCDNTDGYSCFEINGLNKDDLYEIYLESKLIDRENYNVNSISVNTFKFESTINNLDTLSYEVLKNGDSYLYNNILAIKINDSSDYILDRVAYYTLTFEQNGNKLVIDNINDLYISTASDKRNYNEIYILDSTNKKKALYYKNKLVLDAVAYIDTCDESTCLYFDYSKLFNDKNLAKYQEGKTQSDAFINALPDFKNTDLTISLTANYDSGKIDYLNTSSGYYAIKIDDTEDINSDYRGTYFSFSSSSSKYLKPNAFESKFKYSYSGSSISLANYSYLLSGIAPNQMIKYKITKRGFELNVNGSMYFPVTTRIIDSGNITASGDNTFKISKIVPGINIDLFTPIISGAKLNLTLSGFAESDIYDESGKYLYLFATDANSNTKTSKININYLHGYSASTTSSGTLTLPASENIWYDVTSVYDSNGVKIDEENYSYDYLTGTLEFDNYNSQNVTVNYNIVINGLDSNTNYTLTAGLKLGEDKISYLVDNTSSTYEKFEKEFNTIVPSDISVTNIQSQITSLEDYTGRYINLSYNIGEIIGLDNLTYEISYEDNVIDSSDYNSCDDYYNTFRGTCINYDGNKYTANFNVFAKYVGKDKDEFVYGTTYTIKLYADSEKTKLITEDTFDIRSLVDPTFTAVKKSIFKNNDYSLKFTINVNDPDKVISKPDGYDSVGYYNAYISKTSNYTKDTTAVAKDGNGNSITSDYFSARVDNTMNYSSLEGYTRYTLLVKYNTYKNNKGTSSITNSESELYAIYTLNDYGISPGLIDYDGSNVLQVSYLRFSYASNIQKSQIIENNIKIDDEDQEAYTVGISYTVTALNKAYSFSDNALYNKDDIESINDVDINELSGYSSASVSYITGSVVSENVGDSFYELNFPTTYLTAGSYGYQIEFDFYIAGKMVTDLYPTKADCLAVPTNHWIKYKDSEPICVMLSNLRYKKEKNIGGAQ